MIKRNVLYVENNYIDYIILYMQLEKTFSEKFRSRFYITLLLLAGELYLKTKATIE